jgi:hypothetical protein
MASFKSFLSAVGHDFVSVFTFFGSAKGQAAVAGVEGVTNAVATAINPALGASLAGIEGLINSGITEVLKIEASAAALNVQSGTGAEKAAAVIASLAPQAAAFLQSIGVSQPTSTQVQTVASAISGGLVAILNSLPTPATDAAPAAPATTPAAPAA